MKDKVVSKKNLIIEQCFYVFMFLYSTMFCVTFILSAFKVSVMNGIMMGAICGLFDGIFLVFIIFRTHLLFTKKVIYEKDLEFFSKYFFPRKDKEDSVPVEGIVSPKEFEKLDINSDGEISVHEYYPKTEEEVINEILVVDSTFSKAIFENSISHIYRLYEKSINKLDSSIVRMYMSDSMYFRHGLYINELSNKRDIEKRQGIKIKGMLIKDFKIEGNMEIIVVALTSKMKRFFVDEDKYVVSGSEEEYIDMPYVMTLMRNVGVSTNIDLNINNCPNCGATIRLNDSGVCEYCDTCVSSGEYGWVLTDIKVIDI